MNKTGVPTNQKKTFPLRLPPGLYKRIRALVEEEHRKGNYAYSTNELLTNLIEKGLKKEK